LRFVIEVRDAAPNLPQAGELPRRGIDPASPLATSVLMQVCGASACELRLHDALSGLAVDGYEAIDLGDYATYAPSTDLTRLAFIRHRDTSSLQEGQLNFVDLATWQTMTTTLTFNGAYNTPIFSPDNARLVVVTQQEVFPATDVIHLVSVAQGEVLATHALAFYPQSYQFTSDGRGLMFFGMKGTDSSMSHVALLDAETLEPIWQAAIPGLINGYMMAEGSSNSQDGQWWQPAAAFSPNQDILYVAMPISPS
jgi:hypothetical protein